MWLLLNSLGLSSDAEWSKFLDLSNFWIMHGSRNKTNSDEQEAWSSYDPDLMEIFSKYEGD